MFDFLSNPVALLVILGAGAVFIAVIGGNVEGKGYRIPLLTVPQRVCAALVGVVLLGLGVAVHLYLVPQPVEVAIRKAEETRDRQVSKETELAGQIAALQQKLQELGQGSGREQAEKEALRRELDALRSEKQEVKKQVDSTQQVLDDKEAARRESERVVREYYDAINRGNVDAASLLYQDPGPRWRRQVGFAQPGSFAIKEVKSAGIAPDGSYVVVRTDVEGKAKDQRDRQRWQGTITVSKRDGTWKISRMNLAEAPISLASR